MKLSRNDRSRVILGALIALVIFAAAVSPAHCQATPMASATTVTTIGAALISPIA